MTDDVFAVGLNGTVLYYDGTTWTALPLLNQPTYQLRAVYGTSSTGQLDGRRQRRHRALQRVDVHDRLDRPRHSPNLKGVWEANSKNIYAVGGAITVLQSRNATSWTAVATPHGVVDTLRAVWGADSAHVFAVGDAGRLLMYNGSSVDPVREADRQPTVPRRLGLERHQRVRRRDERCGLPVQRNDVDRDEQQYHE